MKLLWQTRMVLIIIATSTPGARSWSLTSLATPSLPSQCSVTQPPAPGTTNTFLLRNFFVNYDCRAISYGLAKIQPSFEANFLPLVFVVSCNVGNLANIEPVLMLVPVADTAGAQCWRAGWVRSRSSVTCSVWTPRSPRRGRGRGVTGATPRATPHTSRPCLTTRPGPWRTARRSWRSGGSEPSASWVLLLLYISTSMLHADLKGRVLCSLYWFRMF